MFTDVLKIAGQVEDDLYLQGQIENEYLQHQAIKSQQQLYLVSASPCIVAYLCWMLY